MQTYSLKNSSTIVPIIEGEALIARSIADFEEVIALLAYRCTVTVYVSRGEARWVSPQRTVDMAKGDLLIHNLENSRCQLVAENDFMMFAICVSSAFTRQFAQSIRISWNIRQALVSNALFHLSSEDRRSVNENLEILLLKSQCPDYPQRTRILKHLLYILSVEILLHLSRYIQNSNNEVPNGSKIEKERIMMGNSTSAQVIYHRFVHLLENTPVRIRPVLWWASQLHITPKYLSAICREVEGRSASSLISETVIQEAVTLLRDPSLTVKEISERLGFANQSHFGTFFKRHTGHSPIRDERKG